MEDLLLRNPEGMISGVALKPIQLSAPVSKNLTILLEYKARYVDKEHQKIPNNSRSPAGGITQTAIENILYPVEFLYCIRSCSKANRARPNYFQRVCGNFSWVKGSIRK